jgi:hypothetical protein
MRQHGYHGGFKHPVRSFLIGTTLIVLLFFGFVAGIELGSPPSGAAQKLVLTRVMRIDGGQVVSLPGTTVTNTSTVTKTRLKYIELPSGDHIVIQKVPGGKKIIYVPSRGGVASAVQMAGVVNPVTVSLPPETYYLTETTTETVTAVTTETVTETATATETVTETTPAGSTPPPAS